MKKSKSHITAVPGFKTAGISCGIKPGGKKDLALIVSETPAVTAAVFTKNRVQAAPVVWSRKALGKSRRFRAILTNSGNANACTGPQGLKDCQTAVNRLAKELSISPSEILIASTGVIGVPLPAGKIVSAMPKLVRNLSSRNWKNTAEAIMTTDLVPKSELVTYTRSGRKISIAGIAKGSGMIHPDMATMLAYIVTDAAISASALKRALKDAADSTFNRITVDRETSTNDTVFVMANGLAGNKTIGTGSSDYTTFVKHLTAACKSLAFQIVEDGEGATKFVTIRVQGAKTMNAAHTVANSIATSPLVKTALFGEDPNWGRILAAAGYAGVPMNPDRARISLNGVLLFKNGAPAAGASASALKKKMRQKSMTITVDLGAGKKSAEVYTCDFSYDYVRINAEYTT